MTFEQARAPDALRGMEAESYREFLAAKQQLGTTDGLAPVHLPAFLFDFQSALVEWSLRKGKGAIFADCGLGKTPMQLVWAENVLRHTNRAVLIITPLAVSAQTIKEGDKFGIQCKRSSDGIVHKGVITVTNYERLHHFDPQEFAGVVCDESSILKSFDGTRRAQITEFMRRTPYRLLCTATAAPNDYIELGTSSETLGEMGYTDMLSRFFVNDQHSVKAMRGRFHDGQWRFKGHAEEPFWKWISSWARAMRKPSDLGFANNGFQLPPLEQRVTIITARSPKAGMLFDVPAVGFAEEREVRRRTIQERCEAAAAQVANTAHPAVVWCHLNDEGDHLERLISDGKQISGADSDEEKEETFEAFRSGQLRVLIIKPKIGAFGLNWQHCAHVVYFPSDSYEQFYQAVRRCWRFGQIRPVRVDIIRTDGQERMMENLQRKALAADAMFTALVRHMNDALAINRAQAATKQVEVPSWL